MNNCKNCEELQNKIKELENQIAMYNQKTQQEKDVKRKYYKDNFDAIKKRKSKYQKANPDKKKEYQKKWREKQKLQQLNK
jgi:hypothetical protein